jgi:PAS domain S-box-containing protein
MSMAANAPEAQPASALLAALLDDDPAVVLWFDAAGRVGYHNRAAARVLGCRHGQAAAQAVAVLGAPTAVWLGGALKGAKGRFERQLTLAGGRRWRALVWSVAGGRAIRLQPLVGAVRAAAPPTGLSLSSLPAPLRDMLTLLWSSPFPATLQDASFRLLDVNDAFLGFSGYQRDAVVGQDPIDLQPADDRDASAALRLDLMADVAQGGGAPVSSQRRLIDAEGRERWVAMVGHNLAPAGSEPLWLTLLHDTTSEHGALDQVRRAQDELALWFDLAGTGMVSYDDSGLIVRSNRAFDALVGQMPVMMSDATPELQALLGWQDGAASAVLVPGAPPLESQVFLSLPDGRRRLGARLMAFATESGARRFMAVVEDRSAEEERDVARLEMGILMDTASVGVATYDPARGWLLPPPQRGEGADGKGSSGTEAAGPSRRAGALQGIGRELVEPDSLPEYEKLQHALRHGERVEVRYEVRHPELGRRWLLTRVEPGALSAARPTTSVVTLDVTDEERAQRRNEQLLRELTTILDGSTAGIAYLRGPLLVRCNRRFERLLGFAPGAAAGASLTEVFGRQPETLKWLDQISATLAAGRSFEAELPVSRDGTPTVWVSLSVRRAEMARDELEAVAVLTDVTRLKAQQTELEQLLRERELMFSLSDVGIVYLRGARIERANQAMATLTGYAPHELTLADPAELYASARECVDFEAMVAAGLRQHGRYNGERRLRRRDGSLLWVQVAVRPVDAEDIDAGMICSFVDVDERHQARESLAVQAGRTRAILNSVLVGIVTVSEGGIDWMNRSARRMFGGELADFVGEPISTVATPEPDHPLRRADYLDTLAEGRAETFECRLKARDGREFWVVGNAVVTGRESTGRQLTFALLDIERRRQAEVSIAQAQASLQRVIETAPLAIALFDARSLRIVQLNQMASTFFDRPLDGLLGCTPEQATGPRKAALLRGWLTASGGDSEVQRRELLDDEGERADSPRVWDTRFVPLSASGADAARLLMVATDVTEQRTAEQNRLQAALAQRDLLVREVHHRIKNNLQGVAGLLQQNAARRPEVATVLSEAVGQVQAIAQVYGLQVGAGGPLRVASVVEAIASSVQRTFGRTIRFIAADGVDHLLPEAESIPIALTVNELLTNAVKHGAAGDLRCAVSADGASVSIVIANPGRLRDGFSLAAFPGGVSGLGLVRALLPRRSAVLSIEAVGDEVQARVLLSPPSVVGP